MQKCNSQLPLLVVTAAIVGVGIASAQDTSRPWMDSQLSPGERSELVLKELTLHEKLALVHGNGMAGKSQWRMPLTHLTNGGAGYTQGVERLGIPPLIISDGIIFVLAGLLPLLTCRMSTTPFAKTCLPMRLEGRDET
jgi:beta-glucosidase